MNDKDTANYINSFFASLTKDFPAVHDKWLAYGKIEPLPTVSKESVANKLRKLKVNKAPGLIKWLKYKNLKDICGVFCNTPDWYFQRIF